MRQGAGESAAGNTSTGREGFQGGCTGQGGQRATAGVQDNSRDNQMSGMGGGDDSATVPQQHAQRPGSATARHPPASPHAVSHTTHDTTYSCSAGAMPRDGRLASSRCCSRCRRRAPPCRSAASPGLPGGCRASYQRRALRSTRRRSSTGNTGRREGGERSGYASCATHLESWLQPASCNLRNQALTGLRFHAARSSHHRAHAPAMHPPYPTHPPPTPTYCIPARLPPPRAAPQRAQNLCSATTIQQALTESQHDRQPAAQHKALLLRRPHKRGQHLEHAGGRGAAAAGLKG